MSETQSGLILVGKEYNKRNESEYILVADGEELYRLPPRFKIPMGLTEVFTVNGIGVYDSKGRLKPRYREMQRIRPQNNMTRLSRSIKVALRQW